jgi:hypothetical protein
MGIKKDFTINKISVNSERSDFGAVLYDDILYFASAKMRAIKYGWNNEPF